MNRTRNLVITGLLIAVGIVLPLAFHTIANAGAMFLPMHIPVLLCGFAAGPIFGMICGVLTPVFSSLMTGMPMVAILPGMVCELATYGFVSGLLFRVIKTKKTALNIYAALLCAMLLGRAVSGFVNGLIFLHGKYTILAWATASFVTALPGIAIQLVLIPALVFALAKANLIDLNSNDIWGLGDGRQVKRTKDYFDGIAPKWDTITKDTPDRIKYVLSKCNIKNGESILDIACGTGIIDNALMEMGAKDVTAIDVSDKMIEIAQQKNTNPDITYRVEDFYKILTRGFDRAIVFNAYPHFTDKRTFVKKLHDVLRENGTFVILHSEPPSVINGRHTHNKILPRLSNNLQPAVDEMRYFKKYFDIIETIDDGDMYMIYGVKKSKSK